VTIAPNGLSLSEMRCRLLAAGWEAEGRKEALDRAPAFGRDFFARLFAEFPGLIDQALFVRSATQPDDVTAFFCSCECAFVQIDPDLEYVIVGDDSGQGAEFGDWGAADDKIAGALAYVRSLLAGKDSA
jgi:hypothetical protein